MQLLWKGLHLLCYFCFFTLCLHPDDYLSALQKSEFQMASMRICEVRLDHQKTPTGSEASCGWRPPELNWGVLRACTGRATTLEETVYIDLPNESS